MKRYAWLCLLTASVMLFAVSCKGPGNGDNETTTTTVVAVTTTTTTATAALVPWIDTHAHPLGTDTDCTSSACVDTIIAAMDASGVRKTIFMHPPSPAADETKEALIRTVVSYAPDRLYYGGGGNTLNALIQRCPETGEAPAGLVDQFDENLQDLLDAGAVYVFGELTALHLSYYEGHAFEEQRADSALFLRLADSAAPLGIPLDIHMDVVAQDMATPDFFLELSETNPATLQENVTAFEELLRHNRSAKIILVHVGRDTTGDMTAELMEQLLEDHDNLYMQIHPVSLPLFSDTAIVNKKGIIRTEWLELLKAYPDRFVMGSDMFFAGAEEAAELEKIQAFLQQLPEDLTVKIGCTNAVTIYGLPEGC
ncbi:amidohydrolase family protein [Thermodesulfobacteriota bacterium]